MSEHTILVAITVNAATMQEAQEHLMRLLPRPSTNAVDCWWIAMDERYDRSDCDSAEFVPYEPPLSEHERFLYEEVEEIR